MVADLGKRLELPTSFRPSVGPDPIAPVRPFLLFSRLQAWRGFCQERLRLLVGLFSFGPFQYSRAMSTAAWRGSVQLQTSLARRHGRHSGCGGFTCIANLDGATLHRCQPQKQSGLADEQCESFTSTASKSSFFGFYSPSA